MILMVGDQNSSVIHYWAGKYPNSIGRLLGPKAFHLTKIKPWLPWGLDNDAFQSWNNNVPWNESLWEKVIVRVSKLHHKPLWVLVPDVVADRDATLKNWEKYYPIVKQHGLTASFAAQDGMTTSDIPSDAEVVFIGGTTEWKWRNVATFCSVFPRVHVGRVNTIDRCFLCKDMGAESVDGTGWFRDGTGNWRFQEIENFLKGEREAELFAYNP